MSSVSQPAAATAADETMPVVHLYTVCWDEADMLGFFFRHYDPWVSRYVVYDDGSTDGSREILARHPRVELRNFDRTDPDSFVLSHKAMQDHAWKESRGLADWVVITAIDEHLHVPGRSMARYLAEQAQAGVTLVPALGFDMNAPSMPADRGLLTEIVTRGRPRISFNKLSLFRPDAIAETGFGPGRHDARPTGHLVLPERDVVMLWHYKHLGFARNAAREASQAMRLGCRDVADGYGQHYLWSRETLRAFWNEMEAEAADLSAAGFCPEAVCKRPLWWRAPKPASPVRPKVSVLIKAYNHAAYVGQTIRSVLDQSFQDFEIVLTDDGSTDETLDILRGFDDARIALQANATNQGIAAAMNATLDRARGEYCAILNSDDWALPERLARQVAFLDANPQIDAVFGMPEAVDEDGAPARAYNDFGAALALPDFSRRSWLRQFFFVGNCLCSPTAMIRRSAYERAGAYDLRLTSLQDLDMWVRMLVAGCRFHVLPEPVTAFRIRDGHANASAPNQSATLRTEFELGWILGHYRAFGQTLFDEVFGAGEPGERPPDASITSRLGELALRVPRPSYRAFALDCLHRAAKSPEEIARLRTLTGSIDLFGECTLAERDNRIADLHAALRERDARIVTLEEAVPSPVVQAVPEPPAAELPPLLSLATDLPQSVPEAVETAETASDPTEAVSEARDPPSAWPVAPPADSFLPSPPAKVLGWMAALGRRFAPRVPMTAVPRRSVAERLARQVPAWRVKEERAQVARILDPDWYRAQNPDLGALDDPVGHYLAVGAAEGRAPHPLFDPDWYDRHGPACANPLLDFLERGHAQGRNPHPLFDTAWYLGQNPDVRAAGYNALVHYIAHGAREGRSPHPLFDVPWYLEHNRGDGGDPLVHYVTGQGTHPHPLFDDAFYRAAIPDLDWLGLAPLTHYVARGAAAGFDPNPVFASTWYVDAHETLRETGQNPLAHYLLEGAREGRDPHPLFDSEFYAARNPDVVRSGANLLVHYLRSGRSEGRLARRPDRLSATCGVLEIPYEVRCVPNTLAGRDACVFVTYSPDGRIAAPTQAYLEALRDGDIAVILVIATEGLTRPLPDLGGLVEGLIVRTNHGWDFAAWASALAIMPDLWCARRVILANDSVLGPTDPARFSALIDRVRRSRADVVALTESHQVKHHLMSYFLVLQEGALKAPAMRGFWNAVESLADKQAVIDRYELTSVSRLTEAGLGYEVLFPARTRPGRAPNPTLDGWRKLVADGFPFLKTQLIRDRLGQCDPAGWRGVLRTNPALLRTIEAELAQPQPSRPVAHVPVPAPRRRYVRRPQLSTFYGAIQAARPTRATDLALEIPFRFTIDPAGLPDRVAVLAHVFHADLAAEIRGWLANIPVAADLFISTDTAEKRATIEADFAGYAGGSVTVRVFPNVGRDIAPMLVGFAEVFATYDIFLHIHAKKSLHDGRFAPWRDHLSRHVLGSPEIVAAALTLLADPDVGIVFPEHFEPIRPRLNWGGNYDLAREVLRRMGVTLSKDLLLEFPSGSVYWGRTDALRPLLDLGLSFDDFPAESGQVDGTLAHAIERVILFVAERGGRRWVKVALADAAGSDKRVPVVAPATLPADLARIERNLLHNRLAPLAEGSLIPDPSPIGTRRDRGHRPRLNLLVPTLDPHRVFGGIATALRVFRAIADALGPDHDLRILCQSRCVDLAAMAELPGYVLVQAGAPDGFPRVVVDLTDPDGGELGLRAGDVFLATAWWTATTAYRLQSVQGAYFGTERPVLYLIQDHETDFYGDSAQATLARETYRHGDKTIALIHSEELAAFMTARYRLPNALVVRLAVNPAIASGLTRQLRERIILVYGRPGTPRNAFPILCAGLSRWQQANPMSARVWRVVSAGEDYPALEAGSLANFEVAGKLSLAAYADLLSRASIGVSLMLSPHPSDPPLEMAQSGLITITNGYDGKDLSRRSAGIVSLDAVSPEALAVALEAAVARAEAAMVGRVCAAVPLDDLRCDTPGFDPGLLAEHLIRLHAASV